MTDTHQLHRWLLFALMCVIVIGFTAIAMDQLIKLAERVAVPWRQHA